MISFSKVGTDPRPFGEIGFGSVFLQSLDIQPSCKAGYPVTVYPAILISGPSFYLCESLGDMGRVRARSEGLIEIPLYSRIKIRKNS